MHNDRFKQHDLRSSSFNPSNRKGKFVRIVGAFNRDMATAHRIRDPCWPKDLADILLSMINSCSRQQTQCLRRMQRQRPVRLTVRDFGDAEVLADLLISSTLPKRDLAMAFTPIPEQARSAAAGSQCGP